MKNLLLAILAMGASAFASDCPSTGTYQGVLHHEKIKRDQLVKIDFLQESEGPDDCQMMAIITLHLGGYDSAEYITYHYSKIRYLKNSKRIFLKSKLQEAYLDARQFTETEILGELTSRFGGRVGKLEAYRDKEAKPKWPLIEPVTGEYKGLCDGTERVLQLSTFRFPDDSGRIGSPFAAYKIVGELAERTGGMCLDYNTPNGLCVWSYFASGSYNFFIESLRLVSKNRTLNCLTNPEGMTCNGCIYKRTSDETKEPRLYYHPAAKKPVLTLATPIGPRPAAIWNLLDLAGEYYGYIHHDYLNLYQNASLNILTHLSGKPVPILELSALATLYFGEADSRNIERLPYQFSDLTFDNITTLTQLVLENGEGDVDGVLQITDAKGDTVSGTWYSIRFGRVGHFLFHRGTPPALPAGAQIMQSVSASYSSPQWGLDISVGLGIIPSYTENPFLPLTFNGRFYSKTVGTNIPVTTSGYDFYTGQIGIGMDDHTPWTGYRRNRDQLELRRMHHTIQTTMPPFKLTPFKFLRAPTPP